MSERFFVREPIRNATVTLDGGEAKHLTRVLRLRSGSEVTLFDGSGAEFASRIVACEGGSVTLEILEQCEPQRELLFDLVVASAVPKGERFRWMIEKLTELGVARLVPLLTERSVVRPRDSVLQRMRRVVIESSKQCGRNRLMAIEPVVEWEHLLAGFGASDACCFGDAQGRPLMQWQAARRSLAGSGDESARQQVILAVGPEGGLTQQEKVQAREAGWVAVSLGRRTLRVETAAVAWAAAVGLASRVVD